MSNLDPRVLDLLRKSGWHEGRDARQTFTLPLQTSLFSKAQEVMAEFGGICIEPVDPGETVVTSDISFDPIAMTYSRDRLDECEKILQVKLAALGFLDNWHGLLVMDEIGRVYYLSLMGHELFPIAPNFSGCLELFLLGRRLSRSEIETIWPANKPSHDPVSYKISQNMWNKYFFESRESQEKGVPGQE